MHQTVVQMPLKQGLLPEKTQLTTSKTANSGVAMVFYGVRYLDPKTSRWISADPAMGEYIPQAPINDEAKKNNKNLPGMGGVFNYVNFHVYHYAGNNPVKLVDPDGNIIEWVKGDGVSDEQMATVVVEAGKLMNSGTEAGRRFKELSDSKEVIVTINVNVTGRNQCDAENGDNATNTIGSNSIVDINVNSTGNYVNEDVGYSMGTTLAHEVSGHAYDNYKGTNPHNPSPGKGTLIGLFRSEQNAVAMENEYRAYKGLDQRKKYGGAWDVPIYNKEKNKWFVYPSRVVGEKHIRFRESLVEWNLN